MTFQEVLAQIRDGVENEREKGSRFEKLIQRWLLSDPRFGELTDVWLWSDFPACADFGGGQDLGIDLVARTDSGDYWAVQCKCYAEGATIDKAAVDSFLAASSRQFTDPFSEQQQRVNFAARLWVSTTENWNRNAEESIKNQTIPFTRVGLADFESAHVDWEALWQGKKPERPRKEPLAHQKEAVAKALSHYAASDRGKLIMACGTGKTYTSLAIIEAATKGRGRILFMVPSIALLGQALNEWMADATVPMRAICICSDPKSSQKQGGDLFEDSIVDLALPATTNSALIAKRLAALRDFDGLVVVFSTYQSIDAVAAAQAETKKLFGEVGVFDWIICDEAHRTTGVKLSGKDESAFTKIHDDHVIEGHKRLYMTATPRLYGDTVKAKAKENDHILCSMDDSALYGEEFFRVGFSYAVAHGLLTDYKVLVLTVGSEAVLPAEIVAQVRDKDVKELDFDMASRLIGCINGLSKNLWGDDGVTWQTDPGLMRRALAFCPNINKLGDTSSSKNTAEQLPLLSQKYWEALPEERRARTVRVTAKHIDGTMNSNERTKELTWLKSEPADPNECRLISNVRCLSEGVDVPSLDAVIFLSARNSQVDVVQSVGRVMRNFRKGQPGEKKYGYIIVPVVVPPDTPPEEALNDNERFKVVWSILNALRSHDDSFNATINKIALNKGKTDADKIVVGSAPLMPDTEIQSKADKDTAKALANKDVSQQLSLFANLKEALYARIVTKVGDRLYWEKWAGEVGIVARNLIGRISELVKADGPHFAAFQDYLGALRINLNESITDEQAVEMLAQHFITGPVFEALFKDYNFVNNNAVSRSLETMVALLAEAGMEKDTAVLRNFYESVRLNLGDIDNLAGKQTVIKNLYERFFKGAFPKTVDQLGIVYTPVECVDFILHSVNGLLEKEFACSLSDENVHILDPFTGTGTFVTRLLQSGLIKDGDLERKYRHEIHCNEMVLLAYYVADVNIESVFHDVTKRKDYLKFENICLADTFDLGAAKSTLYETFKGNTEAIERQNQLPIRVIVGNPPYSAGQKSANDNAQNAKYPGLDARIEQTYVAEVKVTNKNSLYDSYIRAFRWASDRVRQNNEGGLIGFITNGGWLDGNAAAGFRKSLEKEFSAIYVFHLRGDARTSGELRRKEGGNVFDLGSRAPVVITFLIHKPDHQGKAKIYYHDIGDYLKQEEKFKKIKDFHSIFARNMEWTEISPNEHGDWLNLRSDLFGSFIALGDKKDKANKSTFFEDFYSNGVKTNRDFWCYNFSSNMLLSVMEKSISFFNNQCQGFQNAQKDKPDLKVEDFIDTDHTKISWSRAYRNDVFRGKEQFFSKQFSRFALNRPYVKQNLYFDPNVLNDVGNIYNMFPTPTSENLVICVTGIGGKNGFSVLISNVIPDMQLMQNGQCLPLYYYKEKDQQSFQFDESRAGEAASDGGGAGYERRDGITDWILKNVRARFSGTRAITKEHIFYYVYGILHSQDYRDRFNADLKKALPRLPIVDKVETFMEFALKGRKLADLHLNYETMPPHPEVVITGAESGNFTVEKMRFAKTGKIVDKSTIIYNHQITIENIPQSAYEYVVNGRSAIEWIMERYQIKTDKDSGIINNPNHWAEEQQNPRYILNLLASIIHLSTQTVELVNSLPKLEFEE